MINVNGLLLSGSRHLVTTTAVAKTPAKVGQGSLRGRHSLTTHLPKLPANVTAAADSTSPAKKSSLQVDRRELFMKILHPRPGAKWKSHWVGPM